jgi:uncharacterized protein (DUF885 family)
MFKLSGSRGCCSAALRWFVILGIALVVCTNSDAADVLVRPAHVTGLADNYLAEFKNSFPIQYAFSGLPSGRNDGLDINSPAALAKWRAFENRLAVELHTINPDTLAGRPEWITWQYLNQALEQDAKTLVCRNELWGVSTLGWQTALAQLAGIQPVDTPDARASALERWRRLGTWIDQEIANLKEGERLGFLANQGAVKVVIGQLEGMVDGPASKSGLLTPAERAHLPEFQTEWTQMIDSSVLPGLRRYRDFLRNEYLPRARTSPSIAGNPKGRDCYRGLIFGTVTLDENPGALYELATRQVERERTKAVALGRKVYGDRATDWNALARLILADPKNKFATPEEVRDYTQRTYERAYAAANKMVLTPPVGQVKLEPFPDFQQASAPGGQYLPAADDGSRPATYYYRNVIGDLYRASLQNIILHESLPGHHLQIQFLAEHGRKGGHPIGRLLFFSGPGEGWATYAEDFAYEIGLYDSDVDYIGRLMTSITPMMVADLGMQVKGWSSNQAVEYLKEAMPLRPPERAAQSVAAISGNPGFVLAYPLGAVEWEKMRAHAQASLGTRFDVRALHQMELEDGMLPFAALESKLERWIQAGAGATH